MREAIDLTRAILGVPADYRIGIVPASDTGAVEMAMWSLLGARKVEMVVGESFGEGWVTDVVKQLKLDAGVHKAAYGEIVDMTAVDYDADVVFTWNGTTSGVRMPNGSAIPANRQGLTICDATSAAFAQDLPGTNRRHHILLAKGAGRRGRTRHSHPLPPRGRTAESYTPAWPPAQDLPPDLQGKLIEGIFVGETINNPSMLCVEDYLVALKWAEQIGGLPALMARADANAKAVWDFCDARPWIANLATDPANALQHLGLPQVHRPPHHRWRGLREKPLPNGSKRKAWPSTWAPIATPLRACASGAAQPLKLSDITAMLGWLDWAFHTEIAASLPPPEMRLRAHPTPILTPQDAHRRTFGPTARNTPMAPKVLISDELSDAAVQIFRDRGSRSISSRNSQGQGRAPRHHRQLRRSRHPLGHQATEKLIAAATNLKVIGRAGSASTTSTFRPRQKRASS